MRNQENRQATREYYRLDYNKLGSLTAAHSRNSEYDAAYRYDAHGNIEGLLRTTEWGDTLHHFAYHYRGNQLDSLTRRQVMTYTMRPGDMNRDGRVYTDDNIYWGGIDTLVSNNERLPRRKQGTAWKDYTFQLHKTQDENPYYLDANGDGIIDTLDAHAIKEHIGKYYEQIPARQGATYGYRYDESGNMIEDAYKNLKITYNSLNLPDTMTIAGRGKIINTYLAEGTLIKRAYYNAADSLVRQTDYGGMFLYENGSLDKIFTDEGYVSIENGKLRIENFTYNYVLTDHLGHTRSVVSSSGEVLQEHAYYPYGMEIGHLSKQIGSGTNYNYLYTQKEVLDYGGLNFTDHHARLWDYETGRWNGIDPALQMHSPYAGMGMNPMAFVDVDGQEAITLAALGVAALKGAIIASIASAVKYSSEAVAFETWDWGDFGKTVGVSAAMGAVGGAAGGAVKLGGVAMFGAEGVTSGAGLLVTSTTHGLTQGGISAAMGGNFWSGVASGFAGHYVGAGLANAGMEGFGAAAASSVMGGAMSALSGGSFFEGAVVGLIVHMCNQQMGNSEVEKKALQKAHDSYVWRGFEQKDFGVLNDAQRTAHIMNAIRHVNKRGGYTLNIHKVFKDFRHIQSAGAVLGYNSGHVSLSIGDVSFKAQIDLGVFPRANGEYSPIIDISLQRIGEDRYFNYNHNTGKAEHWKAAVGFMLNFATTASQFNYVIEWMGY